jgi:hypothetical protein
MGSSKVPGTSANKRTKPPLGSMAVYGGSVTLGSGSAQNSSMKDIGASTSRSMNGAHEFHDVLSAVPISMALEGEPLSLLSER